MVDDAAQVAVLAPITPAKGAPRPRGGQGQALTALIDEAAVAKRLGITPAQVKRHHLMRLACSRRGALAGMAAPRRLWLFC